MKKIVSFVLALSIMSMMTLTQNFAVSAQDLATPPTDTTTSEPVSSEPTTSKPVSSEPVSSEPTTSKPVSSEPTTSEPVSSQSVSSEPVSSEPVSSESVSSESVSSEPTTSKPEEKLLFGEELYTYIMSLSEKEQEVAIAKLTKEQLLSVEKWLDKQEQPVNEPIDSEAVSFTDVGPFLPPVVGKSSLFARNFTWKQKLLKSPVDVDTEGLVINKSLSEPDEYGKYTVTLEAYVEGTLTSSTVTQNVPTDIVLVLDQSGSMTDSFGDTITYKPWSGNNTSTYGVKDKLYVKVGNVYNKVTITYTLAPLTYTYTAVGKETATSKHLNGNTPNGWDFYTQIRTRISRKDALKKSLTEFVNSVEQKAIGTDGISGNEDDVDHKIAMVGFASKGNSYNNTELLTPSVKTYGSLSNEDYKNALMAVNDNGVVSTNLTTAIGNIDANGGTYIQYGLGMANNILINNPVPEGQKRNQVVIVFTDGYPGSGQPNGNSFSNSRENITTANAAIAEAKIIKEAKATIYTIGVFEDADPTCSINFSSSGSGGSLSYTPGKNAANAYMHFMSSNYKLASNMTNSGNRTIPITNNYYLSAANQSDLNNIFQTISSNIENGEATIELGTDAVVKDILSPYFKLPDNAVSNNDIKVFTRNYTGKNVSNIMTWGAEQAYNDAHITTSGKNVEITNFDFSNNYVADPTNISGSVARGKKLIIKLPIELEQNLTFGGAKIPTNEANSGIYKDQTLLENFKSPTIDLPLRYDYVATDKFEFITRSVDLKNVLGEASGFSADGKNNAYVDIKYTIKNGNTEIATFEIPAGVDYENGTWGGNTSVVMNDNLDKIITIKCRVTAINNSDMSIFIPKTVDLYVYLPTFTCTDTTVDFGDIVTLGDRVSGPHWSTENGIEPVPASLVSAPQLELTYKHMEDNTTYKNSYTVEDKNNFQIVSVMSNGILIKDYTTIIKADCTNGNHAENRDFTIHIYEYELTIQKTGANNELDPNQTFIFNVVGGHDNANFKVAIQGNQSKTIVGLKKGEYQVSEDTNWSWRYSPKANTYPVKLNINDVPTKKVNVNVDNKRVKNKWLSGDNFVVNLFNKKRQGA